VARTSEATLVSKAYGALWLLHNTAENVVYPFILFNSIMRLSPKDETHLGSYSRKCRMDASSHPVPAGEEKGPQKEDDVSLSLLVRESV